MKSKKNVFSITEIIVIVIVTSLVSALSAGLIITNSFQNNSGISYLNLVNDKNLKEFLSVYGNILSGYYEDVDPEAAINSAIQGLTTYLGDKYTTYMTEEEATALDNSLKGTYEGIGISMSVNDPQIVYEVYDESSVQNYPFYQEVIKKTGKEIPIENLALVTQYIEELEEEKPGFNHHYLQRELKLWREKNNIQPFSKETMTEYRKLMEKKQQ